AHPRVAKVNYPGLPSHPQHERANALFTVEDADGHKAPRYGALLSFELVANTDCLAMLNALKVVVLSTHLGDTRTLALPAAHTIYYEMGPEKRAQMGVGDSLLRVSVGIEETGDLLADFRQALESV